MVMTRLFAVSTWLVSLASFVKFVSVVPVVAIVSTAGLAVPAFAQIDANGAIRGVARDEQGSVLPGVTVEAASPSIPGAAVAVTEDDGSYRLLNLAPAEYTVSVSLPGFARYVRGGVVVRAGLNIAIDPVLTVGAIDETVRVTGDSPMLEVHRPVQAINISGELQRALPLGARKDFSDFLEVTPGVVARTFDQGSGGQVYMLRGGEIDNHVIQVDGADVGSFRQGFAGLYVGLSTEALEDTQVKTGGVEASAPLGVGLIVNVVTPSGTSAIKGAASATHQGRRWNGVNGADGQSSYTKIFQTDAALGGPIVGDAVTFFVSARYADREVGIARTADQLSALSAWQPSFEDFTNGGTSFYGFAKATFRLSPNHQAFAFVQRDRNPEVAAFPTDARPFNISAFGGNAVAARWSAVWGAATTTRVLATYNDKSLNGSFDAFRGDELSGLQRDVFRSSFVSGGRRVGSGFLGQFDNTLSLTASPASKLTFQADLTHLVSGWGGWHELQVGMLAQPRLSNETLVRYANGGAALEEQAVNDPANPGAGAITFHRRVYDAAAITSSARRARDYAVYVTDAWKPFPRLTVHAGVRLDAIAVEDRLYGVEVQNSVEVGPRVGATWDLTGDSRNVARFNAGRIADLLQPAYLPTAGGNPLGFTDFYDNNLDGVFETVLRSPPVTPENSNQRVDPDRHQPFVDEWIVGYRRQWPRQFSMDISFVRRAYKHRPAAVEINRAIDGLTFRGYRDEAQNDIYLMTNNRWNTQVYSGLELSVAKRTSTLALIGGYTRGWQHLSGTWQPGDPAALIQPDAFANDAGIGSIRGGDPNSLSGSADARSPSWQKHVLRVGAAWNAPWRFLVASNLVVLSGPYSGPIVTRIGTADPRFGPPTVTLSNGRVVGNPLATTIRFAYATRGQGQIEAPSLVTWNVRVGRDLSIDGRRVSVAADVFNVTNRGGYQQFQQGGNQLYNTTNYAIAPDGSFRGQSRQPPRSAQVSIRYAF
jgi:hypothetical protein